MIDTNIILPSKPRLVKEEGNKGIYEIDNLYPGYGHTFGNSLRRIILSSLPGASITSIKISGADHEFATMDGVKEDVINIILNLKKVRFKLLTDESQIITLKVKGPKEIFASDIKTSGQVEILSPEQYICEVTGKIDLEIEMTIQKGLGYVSKDEIQKEKMEIGHIALDAIFTPIRRVAYDVENMRVGDSTNYNRLIITVETDGTYSPREAVEKSIETMIHQLKAIVGFKEEEVILSSASHKESAPKEDIDDDSLKTRIETLNLSARTLNALSNANIRTVGGLARKKEKDILEIEGLGTKGLVEIKEVLESFGITLK